MPTPASEISAESLSRALSDVIARHELLIGQSSSVASDELMRATVERRDAMHMVRAELDRLPRDALLSEPMIRQRYPHVPEWLPMPFQIAVGGKCPHLAQALLSMPLLLLSRFILSQLVPNRSHLRCEISGSEWQQFAPGRKEELAR